MGQTSVNTRLGFSTPVLPPSSPHSTETPSFCRRAVRRSAPTPAPLNLEISIWARVGVGVGVRVFSGYDCNRVAFRIIYHRYCCMVSYVGRTKLTIALETGELLLLKASRLKCFDIESSRKCYIFDRCDNIICLVIITTTIKSEPVTCALRPLHHNCCPYQRLRQMHSRSWPRQIEDPIASHFLSGACPMRGLASTAP